MLAPSFQVHPRRGSRDPFGVRNETALLPEAPALDPYLEQFEETRP
jgi:hypothetical protein